jgi:hypothetical protein
MPCLLCTKNDLVGPLKCQQPRPLMALFPALHLLSELAANLNIACRCIET